MGSWDNVNEWKSTMGSIKNECDTLVNDTRALTNRLEDQSKRLKITAQDIFNKRDVLIDAAYEALERFVRELLNYTAGDADIGIEGVPNLPVVVRCFKELAEFCERVVDEETREAVEATQEIGEDGQIAERVKNSQERLRTSLNGLNGAVSRAWSNFETHHEHHMSARDALRKAENRKNDVFYVIFGDGGVDDAVRTSRENEDSWHKTADEAWSMWDHLRNLNSEHQSLLNNNLSNLSAELTRIADGMRANYIIIGEDRKVDSKCWLAVRTLQYHVTTNNEYTSRDDALRHVFKLIHIDNKTIDSDSDVIRLKASIEQLVAEKLGDAKAEELHKEKAYLAIPEDMDF
ncbi:hypothetical protein GQ44DRAFT_778542 [Phaeosphaeriaceae sp. PMI808]|nr:hypothetical protein GQ44DRAFT_778542 [Phaeosphaeriaceae sp. PMI808]